MLTSTLIIACLSMVAVSITAIVFATHATVKANRLRTAVEDHAFTTGARKFGPDPADRRLYSAAGVHLHWNGGGNAEGEGN